MRVISGMYKGKRLIAPEGDGVRPTTDRIKETIFNILANRKAVCGASVLDLFCGSGALGIEALSLGANSAVFVDKSPESIRFTRKNLENVGIKIGVNQKSCDVSIGSDAQGSVSCAMVEVYNTGFEVALKKLCGRKFDLILLDPPYADGLETKCLFLIEKYDILENGGIIVLEQCSKTDIVLDVERYEVDKRDFGSVVASFMTLRGG